MAVSVLASCSNNDDEPKNDHPVEPSIGNVFSKGLPKVVDGFTFTTNDKGQVTRILDSSWQDITFEYGTFSRAEDYEVLMKIRYTDSERNEEDKCDIYIQLNNQGFAHHALQIYADSETDTWDFEYNANGQLTRLKRSESDDNFNIIYKDGNITNVIEDYGDGEHEEFALKYTNAKYQQAIPNTGNIMLFDDLFYIDMDEMGMAYYAGLLGKSTKDLPVSGSFTNGFTRSYDWTLDNGLPISLVETDSDGDYEWIFDYKFSWE